MCYEGKQDADRYLLSGEVHAEVVLACVRSPSTESLPLIPWAMNLKTAVPCINTVVQIFPPGRRDLGGGAAFRSRAVTYVCRVTGATSWIECSMDVLLRLELSNGIALWTMVR